MLEEGAYGIVWSDGSKDDVTIYQEIVVIGRGAGRAKMFVGSFAMELEAELELDGASVKQKVIE